MLRVQCCRLSKVELIFILILFNLIFGIFIRTCLCMFSLNFQDMWQAPVKAISNAMQCNDILKNLMIRILEAVYFESEEDRVMSAVNRMVT